MLISQTLSPIVTPGLREAMLFGGERSDWTRILDECGSFKHDDAVLRVLDSEARREEHRREQERKLIWCAPAPAAASVGRPHIFRALFQKDVGGVSGASDVWCDADFVAVDGVSGKLQSWVDYVDNAHLLRQTSVGLQSALPTADAGLANAKSATFVRATANRYQTTRSLALCRHYHDGTGQTQYVLAVPTAVGTDQFLLCTRSAAGGAADLGSQIVLQSTSTVACSALTTSAAVVWTVAGAGSLSNGTPTVLSSQYVEGAGTPEYSAYQKSVLLGSGNSVAAPGVGLDPAGVLTLGSLPGGGGATSARVRSVYTFRRGHRAAERAVVTAFIAKDTGVS